MSKTKQAVNQQDGTVNVKSAQLGKQVAAFLVPDYMEGQKLAIVDESVLDYLTKLLPTASFNEIKHDFMQDCRDMDNLEALVLHAKRFVAFHETCNLLKHYFDKNAKVVMEEPFNAVKPEPTIHEKLFRFTLMEDQLIYDIGGASAGREVVQEALNSAEYNNWLIEKGYRTVTEPVEVGKH